ncbi:MAG: aromatase/cyclase [Erythrobacter sp.]|nr:aromatase/cyclase [Erythrobacter sp.]
MPVVKCKEFIQAPPEEVWSLITEVEEFPRLMIGTVEELKIEQAVGNTLTTAWTASLRGNLLCWRQEEHHDREQMRISYKQIDGDLEHMEGHWQIRPREQGSDVELQVEFEIGIPMLKEILNPLAESALRENSSAMLRSLELKSECL